MHAFEEESLLPLTIPYRHKRLKVWLTIVFLFVVTLIGLITLTVLQHGNFRVKHWWALIEEKQPRALNTSSRGCSNTEQGPVLLSDDKGYVCRFNALSSIREGCCDATIAPRFSCHSCNVTAKCCEIFEFCGRRRGRDIAVCLSVTSSNDFSRPVSCCLSPSFVSDGETTTSRFDFCVARCRTSSDSLVLKQFKAMRHCWEPS